MGSWSWSTDWAVPSNPTTCAPTTVGLLHAGFNVARVDLRGAGASGETCSLLYHAGRTEDLRAVLRALANQPEAATRPQW